jgi:hypothetical protein
VDLVALSFHVQYQWSGLPLDVADEIVVVIELVLWLEQYLNRYLRLGWHHTRHGAHPQRVTEVWTSFDALLGEAEAEGNVLLVDEGDDLSVLALEEKRTELDLARLEENVWLVYSAHDQEVLDDIL